MRRNVINGLVTVPEVLAKHIYVYVYICKRIYMYTYIYIRLVDITAGGDFLGLCDQKSSYKHVSDFGRLRSYDRLKLRLEGNDY